MSGVECSGSVRRRDLLWGKNEAVQVVQHRLRDSIPAKISMTTVLSASQRVKRRTHPLAVCTLARRRRQSPGSLSASAYSEGLSRHFGEYCELAILNRTRSAEVVCRPIRAYRARSYREALRHSQKCKLLRPLVVTGYEIVLALAFALLRSTNRGGLKFHSFEVVLLCIGVLTFPAAAGRDGGVAIALYLFGLVDASDTRAHAAGRVVIRTRYTG